jgi:glycine cleavage system H protein
MSEVKYSKKHEWVKLEGDTATVGITKHATEMLGDIVFAEVPEQGKQVAAEGQAAVVESTKAASDVYSPVSGEIVEGNAKIVEDPSSINTDPEGGAWFFKIKLSNKAEFDNLMTKDAYEQFVKDNPN